MRFSFIWRQRGPYFSVKLMSMGHGNPGVEFQNYRYIIFSPIRTNKTGAFLSHFFDTNFQRLVIWENKITQYWHQLNLHVLNNTKYYIENKNGWYISDICNIMSKIICRILWKIVEFWGTGLGKKSHQCSFSNSTLDIVFPNCSICFLYKCAFILVISATVDKILAVFVWQSVYRWKLPIIDNFQIASFHMRWPCIVFPWYWFSFLYHDSGYLFW